MTEFKGLSEDQIKKIEPYLNPSPLYKKFLTEFTIGSNQLRFYGLPLTMMNNSELISTVITKDPPYVLFPSAIVYEKPMTLLWIAMNEFIAPIDSNGSNWIYFVLEQAGDLNLEEYLQLGRLINYFDVNSKSKFVIMYAEAIDNILDRSTNEDKKVIEVHKSQILKMINDFIEVYRNSDTLKKLFNALLNKAPELLDELKVIPIYDENNVFTGISSRDNIVVPNGYELVGKQGRIVRVRTIDHPQLQASALMSGFVSPYAPQRVASSDVL